jgi:hypothetical protein
VLSSIAIAVIFAFGSYYVFVNLLDLVLPSAELEPLRQIGL